MQSSASRSSSLRPGVRRRTEIATRSLSARRRRIGHERREARRVRLRLIEHRPFATAAKGPSICGTGSLRRAGQPARRPGSVAQPRLGQEGADAHESGSSSQPEARLRVARQQLQDGRARRQDHTGGRRPSKDPSSHSWSTTDPTPLEHSDDDGSDARRDDCGDRVPGCKQVGRGPEDTQGCCKPAISPFTRGRTSLHIAFLGAPTGSAVAVVRRRFTHMSCRVRADHARQPKSHSSQVPLNRRSLSGQRRRPSRDPRVWSRIWRRPSCRRRERGQPCRARGDPSVCASGPACPPGRGTSRTTPTRACHRAGTRARTPYLPARTALAATPRDEVGTESSRPRWRGFRCFPAQSGKTERAREDSNL